MMVSATDVPILQIVEMTSDKKSKFRPHQEKYLKNIGLSQGAGISWFPPIVCRTTMRPSGASDIP